MFASHKIAVPELPPTFLHRQHLSQTLGTALGAHTPGTTHHPYRLVLLIAPAGYGKTALLADTVQRLSLNCCWYFLDHSDQDTCTFVDTMVSSIRQRFPTFGSQLKNLCAAKQAQDQRHLQAQLDALIDTMTDEITEPVILALCNYQEVNASSEINALVNHLLRRLPPQCLLVIESRALPDLEMAVLVARQQIFGLGRDDLRFVPQEVKALAQLQGLPALSDHEATQISTTFDGWIAGILLGSHLGPSLFKQPFLVQNRSGSPPAQLLNRRQLLAFVANEVFHHEAEVYTFLRETALLEQLQPAFCDALRGTTNAACLLEYAERQGLFVTCASKKGELIYACHPLLRELFLTELRANEEARYRALQQRAAWLFYQQYDYGAALKHGLEAQADTLMTRILLEATPQLLDQGQSELVLRCLDSLPAQVMKNTPYLLLMRTKTYMRRGDFASAHHCFEQAEEQITAIEQSEHELASAELTFIRGKLLLHQGKHQQAREQLQLTLQLLPVDERVLRIHTFQQLGICMILSGQPLHQGITQLQQALSLCHPRLDERLARELHHQLANAYEWAGNYTVAEHHRQYILLSQEGSDQSTQIINNLIGLGILKMRQGFADEAEMFFQKTLHLTQKSARFLSSEAYAFLGLGELEWTRQHFPEALMYLEKALSLAKQLEDRYLLNNVLNMQALVYLRMGDDHTAQCLQSQTSLQTNETKSYESMFSTLVLGTILLAQQQYHEAEARLTEIAHIAGETGIHWLQVQALMRLAACYLAQTKQLQARHVLRQMMELNMQADHDYASSVELQAYPELQPLLSESSDKSRQIEIPVRSAARLRIAALGEPSVCVDATPVTRWRMARAMELFFLLLERDQPARKDQIIDALWPEPDNLERINQTFRSTVYYLRQVVGEACLIQQAGLYRLDLRAAYDQFWYDVQEFEEQHLIARRALEEEEEEKAIPAFQKMVDLYLGDYVQAFYSDWCIPRRDELRNDFMDAHKQLALLHWRQEAWDQSLLHWQHLLTLDPCLEIAHQGIMRCYLRLGKRNLAVRQYQRCCQELHEHLGIEPGSALQKLYQRLTS